MTALLWRSKEIPSLTTAINRAIRLQTARRVAGPPSLFCCCHRLFGEIKKVYSISAFDASTKKTIGEQDKSKRVCRFCNNTRTNISFNNIAHAISESLGNKKIILNEECDECNSEFGSASGIESS